MSKRLWTETRKVGAKNPLKNKVKQKPRKYFGKYNQSHCNVLVE